MSIEKDGKNPEKDAENVMESEGGGQKAVPPSQEADASEEGCARCGQKLEGSAADEMVRKDGKFYCSEACAQSEASLERGGAKEPEQEDPVLHAPEGRRHGGAQPAPQNRGQKSKQPHEPAAHARKR